MKWFSIAIWEIKRSPSTMVLGLVLCLSHIVTYFVWKDGSSIITSPEGLSSLCWGYLPNCNDNIQLSSSQIQSFLTLYISVSTAGAVLFATTLFTPLAWLMLALAFAVKFGFYFLDQSLSSSLDTGLFFINLGFLFVPYKLITAVCISVATLIFSSMSQLGTVFMLGNWIAEPLQLSNKTKESLAALVILAQFTLPLFWLARKKARFRVGVLASLSFAALIYYLGNQYYGFQLGLLTLFIFSYASLSKKEEEKQLYQSYLHPNPSKVWLYIFLCGFFATQFSSWLHLTPERLRPVTITKEATPQECHYDLFARHGSGVEQMLVELSPEKRVACDPMSFKDKVSSLCKKVSPNGTVMGFFDVLYFGSKSFMTELEGDDLCKSIGGL